MNWVTLPETMGACTVMTCSVAPCASLAMDRAVSTARIECCEPSTGTRIVFMGVLVGKKQEPDLHQGWAGHTLQDQACQHALEPWRSFSVPGSAVQQSERTSSLTAK